MDCKLTSSTAALCRNETMESLQALQDATNLPDLRHMVPEDVLNMIDTGRNPDIHTRTFTNRLNSDNQQMRGQALSFDVRLDRDIAFDPARPSDLASTLPSRSDIAVV